jgi:hypothetical protein
LHGSEPPEHWRPVTAVYSYDDAVITTFADGAINMGLATQDRKTKDWTP